MATYKAHTGAVWGIHVRPDGRGLVSGSADNDVKFWDFEMKEQDTGERIQNRLGQETIVSNSNHPVRSLNGFGNRADKSRSKVPNLPWYTSRR